MAKTTLGAGSIAIGGNTLTSILKNRLDRPAGGGTISFYDRSSKSWWGQTQVEFLQRALGYGLHLRENGLKVGDRTIVACASPEATLLGFVGSMLVGGIPSILPIRTAFDSQSAVADRLLDTMILLGQDAYVVNEVSKGKPLVPLKTSARSSLIDVRSILPSDDINEIKGDVQNAISHVQLTSGSTGAGKGVAVTHANVLANIEAVRKRGATTAYDVCVTWLPLYHDMGLISQALMTLAISVDVYFMSPFDFLAEPAAWIRTMSDVHGTVTASPAFGYELAARKVTDEEVASFDLSHWKSAYCGAEPIRPAIARKFYERFAPAGLRSDAFTPSYGLAEATLAVTSTAADEPWRSIFVSREGLTRLGAIELTSEQNENAIEVMSLGKPIDGMSIQLVDNDGKAISDELTCGEIIVSGTSVAAGWIVDGGSVQKFSEDGLHTGDVGFIENGDLFVVERTKNILIRNGQNYSSHVLERRLADLIDLDTDRVVVFDRDLENGAGLTAIVEVDTRSNTEAYLAKALAGAEQFEPPLESIIFVKRGALPRTTSGKKRHIAVRDALAKNVLPMLSEHTLVPVASVMSEALASDIANIETDGQVRLENQDHESRLLELIARKVRSNGLDVPVVMASRLQYDLDFDSLGLLELAMQVEDAFSVHVTRERLTEVKTVRDLMNVVLDAESDTSNMGVGSILEMLRSQIPQNYTTVDDVAPNRRALIDGRWMDDFASSNYLGLDDNPLAYEAQNDLHQKWGMQRCWTRAVATPRPMIELEKRLANLIGVPDTMIFPTVTLLHFGVLPLLAGADGALIVDTAAHKSMHEAAALARAKGAAVTTFVHRNEHDLEQKLIAMRHKSRRIIVVDGVYSMSGQPVDVARYQALARKHDAVIYLDDAHGFGVLGESPSEEMPFGFKGNGTVKHSGCDYDRILYVGGLSKAFSTMAAFISVPNAEYRKLFQAASTMIFIHSVPIGTLAQAAAGLSANEVDGEQLRENLYSLTQTLREGAISLGFEVSPTEFPIVNVIMGDLETSLFAINQLWQDGIMLTPAIFPAAPLNRGGLRLSVTATNTPDQIDRILGSLARVRKEIGRRNATTVSKMPAAVMNKATV